MEIKDNTEGCFCAVSEGDLVGFKPNTEKRFGMPQNCVGQIICWDDQELGYRLKWKNPKDKTTREVTLDPGDLLFLKELSDEAIISLYGFTYKELAAMYEHAKSTPQILDSGHRTETLRYIVQTEDRKTEAPQILDSGNRTKYETGAVRDCKEGKGRCDLMPLDVVAYLLESDALDYVSIFKETGRVVNLYTAICAFTSKEWRFTGEKGHAVQSILLEVSKHFEEGAKKYGPNNWQKGIPVHSYIDSAVRHYLKYRAGWADEPHDRAFVWNLMCCIWTMKHHPELDDFTDKKEVGQDAGEKS